VDRVVLQWRKHTDSLTSTSPRWRRAYTGVRNRTVTARIATPEQRELARRAYLAWASGAVAESRSRLARRDFARAGKEAAKAAAIYAQLGQALTVGRLRSAR
jgi:hypothetical protein